MESTRPAQREDIDRLVELADCALAELSPLRGGHLWAAREKPPEPRGDEFVATLDSDTALLQVGCIDGYPVGYGLVRGERLRTGVELAVVSDIYVEVPFRGVAVGEAVMDALLNWARARGCIGVDSLVLPGMRDSKNFFERYGLKARALLVHRSFIEEEEQEDAGELEPSSQASVGEVAR